MMRRHEVKGTGIMTQHRATTTLGRYQKEGRMLAVQGCLRAITTCKANPREEGTAAVPPDYSNYL